MRRLRPPAQYGSRLAHAPQQFLKHLSLHFRIPKQLPAPRISGSVRHKPSPCRDQCDKPSHAAPDPPAPFVPQPRGVSAGSPVVRPHWLPSARAETQGSGRVRVTAPRRSSRCRSWRAGSSAPSRRSPAAGTRARCASCSSPARSSKRSSCAAHSARSATSSTTSTAPPRSPTRPSRRPRISAPHPAAPAGVPFGTVVRALRRGRPPGARGRAPGRIFVGNTFQFEGYTGGGGKAMIDGLMGTGTSATRRDGRLFIDGRDDEMIISGGENLFPAEVEELLATHPGVAGGGRDRRAGR